MTLLACVFVLFVLTGCVLDVADLEDDPALATARWVSEGRPEGRSRHSTYRKLKPR